VAQLVADLSAFLAGPSDAGIPAVANVIGARVCVELMSACRCVSCDALHGVCWPVNRLFLVTQRGEYSLPKGAGTRHVGYVLPK
jgi:hypothetical protein